MVFSLFLLMTILSLGALGVDLMRFEMERAKLQSTLDRAVLAAADMDQVLDPEMVVNDYFAKSGLEGTVTGVTVTDSQGFRAVNATARKSVESQLIHMFGVDSMNAPASGTAEERVDSLEISLVLDISGSMGYDGRITNLINAGVDFVDTIFDNSPQDKVSMSLVPYTGQVNIGPDLIDKYNITDRHDDSFCVDLPPSVYTSAALSRSLPMPQHVFADTHYPSNTNSSYDTTEMAPAPVSLFCSLQPMSRVRVHSNNPTELKDQIRSFVAFGYTSIDAGMRWGSALLDPSARGIVEDLVDEGVVSAPFRGRPLSYDDPDVLKVLVLMTDGEHFPNEFINEGFRSGLSPVWRDRRDGLLSIYHPDAPGDAKYWAPHMGAFYHNMWGGWFVWNCSTHPCTRDIVTGFADQLTWEEVWKIARVSWVAQHLYYRALGGTLNHWINWLRTIEGTYIWPGPNEVSAMDNRLLTLCESVKEQGVVVYTVAFEAPFAGGSLLRECASSYNHAFDVTGLEISSAFSSIANSIRKLRVTQ